MPTTRQTVLAALHARLQPHVALPLRDEVLPERIPAAGLLIRRDRQTGAPKVTLSPLRYHWRDTAIRGHVLRGTGILNNALYIGQLVWNRMRYLKDPQTGRRVSRINTREDWVVLRHRLMEPNAVAHFVKAATREVNAGRHDVEQDRRRAVRELEDLTRKIDRLYDAIADGLRTPGLAARLKEMEARKSELAAKALQKSDPVRLHPNLSELYRRKVADLAGALADAAIRQPALDGLRSLIEAVVVQVHGDATQLEVQGALTAMLDMAEGRRSGDMYGCSVKLVAGARNRRNLPPLRCAV